MNPPPAPSCPVCGALSREIPCTKGVHYARRVCSRCGKFLGWVPAPWTEQRSASHRRLVEKFGRSRCQLCGAGWDELPQGESLEAHHVEPYSKGGGPEEENILALCTLCHRIAETLRRHVETVRKREALNASRAVRLAKFEELLALHGGDHEAAYRAYSKWKGECPGGLPPPSLGRQEPGPCTLDLAEGREELPRVPYST